MVGPDSEGVTMRILAAVDGSAHTKRMLAYIAAHDEWLGPQHDYTIVHAVNALPQRAAVVLDRALVDTYYDDECERVFKPIRAFVTKQGLRARFVGKVGAAAEIIVALAARGRYDLIAMGSHGHSNLSGLVLGSATSKVLARARVPVLVIR